MKYYFLLFFFLFYQSSFSQTIQLIDTTYFVTSDFGKKITFRVKDFNRDGHVDTLSHFYSGGSGYGGRIAKLINGKTEEVLEANYSGCFCSLVDQWMPSKTLLLPKNLLFKEILENSILPLKKPKADHSLQWIISAAYHQTELSNHPSFNKILNPEIQWSKQPILSPSSYRIWMRSDSLDIIVPKKMTQPNQQGWLIYYGHNHFRSDKDDWTVVGEDRKYKIYKTQHGLIANKGMESKWVFVTELNLTGAPQKLRWESIRKVELVDNFLVVQLRIDYGEEYKIFIIEIESGVVGEMKFKVSAGDVFEITKGKINIIFEEEKRELDLDLIFQELVKVK